MDQGLGHFFFRHDSEPNCKETVLDHTEAPPLRNVVPFAAFPITLQEDKYTASCVAFLSQQEEPDKEQLETVFAPYLSKVHLPPVPQPKRKNPNQQEGKESKQNNRKRKKPQLTQYKPTIQDSLVAIQESL